MIDKIQIENLAELAKIELTEEEKENLIKDLENILNYVKQITDVNFPQIGKQIDYYLQNVWREDILCNRDFSRELIISQFSDSKDGFVKVKKIL